MLFSEEKVDFNKLINITSKIFPMRQRILEIIEIKTLEETYSSLQILRLYSLYLLIIENDEDKSHHLI
jgi:hypothetical protein